MDEMPYVDSRDRIYRYGEFFPTEFCPFAYNESLAQEYFPLNKEKAELEKFTWRNAGERNYIPTIKAEDLPDNINDVEENITQEIIECLHKGECNDQCTNAFKIIPDELQFYKKMQLPLPRLCPKCRSAKRLSQRTKLNTLKKKCQCAGDKSDNGSYKNNVTHSHGGNHCEEEFFTNYTDESDILYCEKCYQQEVY